MITKEQAFNNTVFHEEAQKVYPYSTFNNCRKWRINGKIKTWKLRPWKFSIPIKYGLKDFGYITENNLEFFHLPEDCINK